VGRLQSDSICCITPQLHKKDSICAEIHKVLILKR
jgi:hypothetical protein